MSEVEHCLEQAVTALGGSRRAGQAQMASAISEAIEQRLDLLVQAGTGTGKSLAYLVPAVLHAVGTDERVIVSTATLALQRQLMTSDLPLVATALEPELPRPATFAVLKGWANYVCRQKLAGGYPPEEEGTLFAAPRARTSGAESLVEQVRRAAEWARESGTGDRDDLAPGVSDRAWRQMSVSPLECLGSRCPLVEECFAETARSVARAADVVVTNHAMLGIAAGGSPGVLPDHDVVIVDEAHELVDRVTSAATGEISQAITERTARAAQRLCGIDSSRLLTAAGELGAVLRLTPESALPEGPTDVLITALGAVRDAARQALTDSRTASMDGLDRIAARKVAQADLLMLFEVAERLAQADPARDVFWTTGRDPSSDAERGGGEGSDRLFTAPLSVSGLIGEGLLSAQVGVFTSATLMLGGDFELAAASFGLGPAGGRWRGLDVGSPFDFRHQGILYIARHLPPPGRDPVTEVQLDEIADLIAAASGRTLALFTSRRAVEEAGAALRKRLEVPILLQYEDQVPALVSQFLADPAMCLFGTRTLWQGVDLPGDSCQLVIIGRIPFPRPDDPISSARARAVQRAGGNGFMQVSAAHAALLLAQGAGRLIRTTTDRGVVAVLDPRLVTARYGSFLRRSMPPFWLTTDRKTALEALRRLTAEPEPARDPEAGDLGE